VGERMIRLDGISRTFDVGGEPVKALADVHEEIATGEHLAIMGPSGSGKSTLLNILGCLDRPDRGVYELLGRDVAKLDEEELSLVRRHTIGFVFQFFHLVPRLTALDNVELPMVFAGIERGERRERALGRLRGVGLEARAGHRPDQLSGGERQRVAIARATVLDPKLLLADEPTGNLDTASGRHVLEILEQMNAAGLTLVVVTHDPAVARRARRVLVLQDGQVVRRGSGADIHQAVEILSAAEATPESAR
jgi:putative ABC transport system ATP-binding protein